MTPTVRLPPLLVRCLNTLEVRQFSTSRKALAPFFGATRCRTPLLREANLTNLTNSGPPTDQCGLQFRCHLGLRKIHRGDIGVRPQPSMPSMVAGVCGPGANQDMRYWATSLRLGNVSATSERRRPNEVSRLHLLVPK